MADVRNYIQINPIDTDKNKAVGVSLPYNGTAVFNSTYTTQEQMKSNMLNVLLTEPGERIYKPNFGVGLRNYLFENFTDLDTLKDRINNQVERYVPQVELTNVNINKDPNSHELSISIFYKTTINNQSDAIQVNFSPDNGINTSNSSSPSVGGY
tara:strand:+ start:1633 stop:2094 length:462 start_codon:yes stop_codon:yes gene_type:complete